MHLKFNKTAAFFFFLFFPFSAHSQAIQIQEFLQQTNAVLSWDPFLSKGILSLNEKLIVFYIDENWYFVNFQKKITADKIVRENGNIVLTKKTADLFQKLLGTAALCADCPNVKVILIDPGHGGKDPGAIATHKINGKIILLQEKDVVLKTSLLLYDMLKKRFPQKRILLTRTSDTFPSLEDRVEIANSIDLKEHEAIIFISMHVNASLNKDARGYEVWFLPPDIRRDVIDEKKQKLDSELVPIFNTMKEEEYTVESILLAKNILGDISVQIGNAGKNRGLKQQSWFVVRNAKMPSVLIELGFITNLQDALVLIDSEYLKKYSFGIYNGICQFIDKYEKTKGFTN